MIRYLLALVLLVVGCAPPSRLALAATAYEDEATALLVDLGETERAYKTTGAEALAACDLYDEPCARAALAPVHARYAPQVATLDRLTKLAGRMRSALDTAKKCRASRDTCESENVRAAERDVAQLHYDRVRFEEQR